MEIACCQAGGFFVVEVFVYLPGYGVFNGLRPPTHYFCEERRDILRFKHWMRDVLHADVVGVILSHQAYQAIGGLGTRMPDKPGGKKVRSVERLTGQFPFFFFSLSFSLSSVNVTSRAVVPRLVG